MNNYKIWLIALTAISLAACRTAPPPSVFLHTDTLSPQNGTVGIMVTSAKVDTSFPGAGCLLCLAVASGANSSLTKHTHAMSNQDVLKIKDDIAEALRKKGVEVSILADDLNEKSLKDNASQGGTAVAKKDYRPLKVKYHVDHLVHLNVDSLGFERNYSAYIARGDPVASLQGLITVVNLSNNEYELYQPISVIKVAEGPWDEAPDYPGLTNAYYSAVESAREQVRRYFDQCNEPCRGLSRAQSRHTWWWRERRRSRPRAVRLWP
jgi:hypothetical protein